MLTRKFTTNAIPTVDCRTKMPGSRTVGYCLYLRVLLTTQPMAHICTFFFFFCHFFGSRLFIITIYIFIVPITTTISLSPPFLAIISIISLRRSRASVIVFAVRNICVVENTQTNQYHYRTRLYCTVPNVNMRASFLF